MWNNYFFDIINKYNLKIGNRSPLVIFLDGKNITSSKDYNLINENKGSFNDFFEQAVKHFSEEFECLAIFGVDEVSFIFENHNKLEEFIKKEKYKVHDIVSIFSQHFFSYFNNIYKKQKVYWHCKCSIIPKGKIKSYIKHRSLQIYELQLTYFLKRNFIENAGKIKLQEKIEKCSKYPAYNNVKEHFKGKLYKAGQQIELEAFLRDEMVPINETHREEFKGFLDIRDF